MNRIDFKIKANKNIDEIYNEIENLKKKKDQLSSSLKQKYDSSIEALNKRKEDLKKKYEAIQNAPDSNWEKAKNEFTESFNHYKEGFKELSKLFK